MKKIIVVFAVLIHIILIESCATNPVSKKKQVVFMSEAQEISMGKESDPQIIAQFGLYEDQKLQDFITEKGKQMAAISHRPNLEFFFRVVDSEVLNAFAVPGGYVYFTRGIMAHFNNEAQFAGVLGHEIGHIAARHSVEQQRNQILGQGLLIAGVILAPDLAGLAQPASQGLALALLKFGRDAERESDRLGVEYSSKINYNAHEMAGFFTTLERQSAKSGQGEMPEFLSTHPNPGDRNKTVSKLATEWQEKLSLTNAQVNRNQYLKRIEGLIYGEDPRQGYLENQVFYHPSLKFQFNVPGGWQYQNTPSQVQLAEKNGKALMILTGSKGNSLKDAANGFLQQNSLQPLDAKETTINGLPALIVVADAASQDPQQQGSMRASCCFIQHGEMIYLILGASSQNDFSAFQSVFANSQQSFKELSDPAKVNKEPERIRLTSAGNNATLEQVLRNAKVDENRLEEHAILNGMLLGDNVSAGTLVKVISRTPL